MEKLPMMHKIVVIGILFLFAFSFGPISTASGEYQGGSIEAVPGFVLLPPKDHFAGVSGPCKSIQAARRAAISDVTRQVLSAIGTSFDHRFLDRVYGNPHDKPLHRFIEDHLSGSSKGIVFGVEQRIVQSRWSQDETGRFNFYVLVNYPERLISELRRLSKGACLVALVKGVDDGIVTLSISEVNGVEAVVSSVELRIEKQNRFAKAISFFVWPVHEISEKTYLLTTGPTMVCNGSAEVRFPRGGHERTVMDFLLGATVQRTAILRGHDEIGRAVSTTIQF